MTERNERVGARGRSEHKYVGPALLTRARADQPARQFRGRVVRDRTTGAYRFYVNRANRGKVPADWPHEQEWTDDFQLTDIEWLGKKPDGV